MSSRAFRMRMRPLLAGEESAVRQVFDGLSPLSRYRRFHAATPRLTRAALRSLTAVDGVTHVALVMEVARDDEPWAAVGIARFIRVADATAEVAVAVVDSWQGRGVGRRLLRELGETAAGCGVGRLAASAQRDNRGIAKLFCGVFPGTTVTYSHGLTHFDCLVRPAVAPGSAPVVAPVSSSEVMGAAA